MATSGALPSSAATRSAASPSAAQQMLDIVEHQQEPPGAQIIVYLLLGRTRQLRASVERSAKRLGQRRRDPLCGVERGQRHKADPVGEALGREQLLGQRDGQAGLAHAARPHDRHKPRGRVGKQRGQRGQLGLAANQRRRLVRQPGVALRCAVLACGSSRVASDRPRRRQEGRARRHSQRQAVGELLGQLPRGRRTPRSIFLIVSIGAEGPLRQRLLGHVAGLAQPPQQPAKWQILIHSSLIRTIAVAIILVLLIFRPAGRKIGNKQHKVPCCRRLDSTLSSAGFSIPYGLGAGATSPVHLFVHLVL